MSTANVSSTTRAHAAANAAAKDDGARRHAAVRIGVVGLLFALLFNDFLYRAVGIDVLDGFNLRGYAWNDGNWSHALIVPFISLYFLYQHRERLLSTPVRTGWLGLGPLLIGIFIYALAIGPTAFSPGDADRQAAMALRAFGNDTVKGYAMVLALFGLVWLMAGWRILAIAWFPIAYLVFAVKISDRIWESIAFKLQGIAAVASGIAINLFGPIIDLAANVSGNTIHLTHHGEPLNPGLNVAEACSGLRMLMTFIALGVAVAYLAERPWWARLVMVLLTVPIAVFVNVIRVTALGFIYPYDKELATGDFHLFVGMLMLIPALGLFLLVGWVLNQILIPEPQTPSASRRPKVKVNARPAPQANTSPDRKQADNQPGDTNREDPS